MKHGFEIPFPSFTISVSLTWKLQFLTFLPCDPVAEVLSQRQELQYQAKRLSIWLSQSLSSCSRHGETDTSTICSTTRTQTTCYKLIYFWTPIMLKAFSPLIILPSSEKSCLTVTPRVYLNARKSFLSSHASQKLPQHPMDCFSCCFIGSCFWIHFLLKTQGQMPKKDQDFILLQSQHPASSWQRGSTQKTFLE